MSVEDSSDVIVDPAAVRLAAMNLLARREHSVLELRRKLKRRFHDDAVLDEQLDRLARENLQSDTRFCESYVRQRINRGYGPLRLREELRERGISRSIVTLTLEELDIDWYAHADAVMQTKFGEVPADDIKEKARRARFMQHRGFSGDHYHHLLQD
jgi:regulatory protein